MVSSLIINSIIGFVCLFIYLFTYIFSFCCLVVYRTLQEKQKIIYEETDKREEEKKRTMSIFTSKEGYSFLRIQSNVRKKWCVWPLVSHCFV